MQSLSQSVDFTRAAQRYDETRNLPTEILVEAYRRLIDVNFLKSGASVLDAGCGTGQVSLPLLVRGFSVTGIDLSAAMMQHYISKFPANSSALLLTGDVQRLPFASGTFDVTIVSKLFEHIPNWRLAVDEILRVTSGSCILISERGHFGNAIRQQATDIAVELGYTKRFQGVANKEELVAYFQAKGCQVSTPDVADLRWEENITYGQALQDVQDRLFAEYWGLSDADYQTMLAQLQAWIDHQPLGLETRQKLFPYLTICVFSKQ